MRRRYVRPVIVRRPRRALRKYLRAFNRQNRNQFERERCALLKHSRRRAARRWNKFTCFPAGSPRERSSRREAIKRSRRASACLGPCLTNPILNTHSVVPRCVRSVFSISRLRARRAHTQLYFMSSYSFNFIIPSGECVRASARASAWRTKGKRASATIREGPSEMNECAMCVSGFLRLEFTKSRSWERFARRVRGRAASKGHPDRHGARRRRARSRRGGWMPNCIPYPPDGVILIMRSILHIYIYEKCSSIVALGVCAFLNESRRMTLRKERNESRFGVFMSAAGWLADNSSNYWVISFAQKAPNRFFATIHLHIFIFNSRFI